MDVRAVEMPPRLTSGLVGNLQLKNLRLMDSMLYMYLRLLQTHS